MLNYLFLIALASSGPCTADEAGYCSDPVVTVTLRTSEPTRRIKVNCTLGSVLAVQLPEGDKLRAEPAIGNAALFQHKLQADTMTMTLLLWPQVPEGSKVTSESLEGETSNVQIDLASGITILLEMKIAYEPGVQRLVLQFPELTERIAKRRELKQEIREEVEKDLKKKAENIEEEAHAKAIDIIARGMLKRVHCTGLREREMRDLLVVWGHRVCHIGDQVYIELSIHNRARDLFALKSVEVLAVAGDKLEPLDATVVFQGGEHRPQLKFDRQARAVAVVPVTEDTAAAEYAVRITESAGKKRVVVLDGIAF